MSCMLAALDLGRVCVGLHLEKMIECILAQTGEKERAPLESRLRFLWNELERGRMETELFFSTVRELCGGIFSEEELRRLWCGQILDPVPGTFEAAQELVKHGYGIAFFSNTSEIHLREIQRKCPVCRLGEGGVYSFEEGLMKPEEEMYARFEAKFGIPAVFFDDNAANVAAAKKRGWDARLFNAAGDILDFLRR